MFLPKNEKIMIMIMQMNISGKTIANRIFIPLFDFCFFYVSFFFDPIFLLLQYAYKFNTSLWFPLLPVQVNIFHILFFLISRTFSLQYSYPLVAFPQIAYDVLLESRGFDNDQFPFANSLNIFDGSEFHGPESLCGFFHVGNSPNLPSFLITHKASLQLP